MVGGGLLALGTLGVPIGAGALLWGGGAAAAGVAGKRLAGRLNPNNVPWSQRIGSARTRVNDLPNRIRENWTRALTDRDGNALTGMSRRVAQAGMVARHAPTAMRTGASAIGGAGVAGVVAGIVGAPVAVPVAAVAGATYAGARVVHRAGTRRPTQPRAMPPPPDHAGP
jgi:hypothetical protein